MTESRSGLRGVEADDGRHPKASKLPIGCKAPVESGCRLQCLLCRIYDDATVRVALLHRE